MTEEEVRSHIRDILAKTHLMHLGTVDDGGPWVSSVIFVYDDDLNLYWMRERGTRHSQALLKNPQVAATITFSTKSKEPNEGLQISGHAEKLGGEIYELYVKHLTKRGYPPPQPGKAVLDPEESWYKLVPEKNRIDLRTDSWFRQSVARPQIENPAHTPPGKTHKIVGRTKHLRRFPANAVKLRTRKSLG